MFFPFTDTPQIEEVMYQWTDESIEQFLDEQGDIVGMEIQCDEFKQNDYTVWYEFSHLHCQRPASSWWTSENLEATRFSIQ